MRSGGAPSRGKGLDALDKWSMYTFLLWGMGRLFKFRFGCINCGKPKERELGKPNVAGRRMNVRNSYADGSVSIVRIYKLV